MILIITPTLNRPDRMRQRAREIRAATRVPYQLLYVTEARDRESHEQALMLRADGLASLVVNSHVPSYAGAVNAGYASAVRGQAPFTHVFTGADDLLFTPGWDILAMEVLISRPELRVAGTNDLHSPKVVSGESASHYLIDRRYIDGPGGVIDQPPGVVLCELYRHNFTDTEFTETAKSRDVWAPCLDAVVEHCHPIWGRGEWDYGYRKSQDPQRAFADGYTLTSRRHLWKTPRAVP
jgi:hypothetical protein